MKGRTLIVTPEESAHLQSLTDPDEYNAYLEQLWLEKTGEGRPVRND